MSCVRHYDPSGVSTAVAWKDYQRNVAGTGSIEEKTRKKEIKYGKSVDYRMWRCRKCSDSQMCQNSEVFDEICIASRTVSKCDALKEKLKGTIKGKDHDCAGGCGQRDGPDSTDQEGKTGRGIKSGAYRIRI